MKIKSRLVTSVVVSAVVLLGIFFFRGCSSEPEIDYVYDEVTIGPIGKSITATGKLALVNSQIVFTRSAGTAERVYADFNQKVRKGQVLALISSDKLGLTIKKLRAAHESALLNLQAAAKELKGNRNLYKEKMISKQGMELAEIKYKRAMSAYKQVQVDYLNALDTQKNLKLVSPVSGIVVARTVEQGKPVGPGKPAFEIVSSLENMELVIHVDEGDIGYIKKSQPVTFTVAAFPEKIFEGIIKQVRIKPVQIAGTVGYQAVVVAKNVDDLLKPGMNATAVVKVASKKKALRISNQALSVNPDNSTYEPGKNYIWKKSFTMGSDIPADKIPVKLGLAGDNFTEILEGVKAGDKLLIQMKIIK